MDRRSFMRFAAGSAIALPFPLLLKDSFLAGSSIPAAREWKEWGKGLPLPYSPDETERQNYKKWAVEYMQKAASKELPSGTIYELRLSPPTDFGRVTSLAYYGHSRTEKTFIPLTLNKPEFDPCTGCYRLGRFLT